MALAAVCVLVAGCTPTPLPPAFTGPVAHLSMTEIARGNVAADVVYVSKINGQDFLGEIYPSQPGPNMPLNPITGVMTTVDIPAAPTRFTLHGNSIFQAPIFALSMANYCVAGDVNFTPIANENYILRGTFTPTYSAIWIEDEQNGTVQDHKIEIHGSAKAGLVKKFFGNPDDCEN